MKIIITGATGFLGRNLAEAFNADGLKVAATGRSEAVGDELRKKGIAFQKADLLDSGRLNRVFFPADCVIHCAARSGPWGRYRDFYDANVVGTRHVIRACREHGIKKIIYVSTPSVYFSKEDRYNISEDDPLPAKQMTHYSKTKLIAEKEIWALQTEGYQVISFRPRALYGPYDNTLIPRILRVAEKKQPPLVNEGRALMDITYVDNFIDAVRRALSAPDHAWNNIYNISNGDPITVKDWMAQVLEIFDRPFNPKNIPEPVAMLTAGIVEFISYLPFINKEPPITRFTVGYTAKSLTMSIEKAKKQLGYSPKIGNREGFMLYAQWIHSKNQRQLSE